MIKLRDAKCPNCGANIQVNDKLENTICQYCGSQVIIEEAIEKYKLEISGSVEVDGIQGRSAKIKKAKKHIKIGEYDSAKKIFQDLILEDSLDTEAYIELLKVNIMQIREDNFDENLSVEQNENWKKRFDEIKNCYDRIKKIDDENLSANELAEYQVDIEKYLLYLEKIETFQKERAERQEKYNNDFKELSKEVTEKLNNYLKIAGKISDQCYRDCDTKVYETFNSNHRGCLYDSNGEYTFFNSDVIEIKELKYKSDILFGELESFLQNNAKMINDRIDKNIKTLKLKRTIVLIKLISLSCAWIFLAFMLIESITALPEFIFVMFLAGGLIYLCTKGILSLRYELKSYDIDITENYNKKLKL